MSNYCCFLHPKYDHSDSSLDDECDECGRPFNFPLDQAPQQIQDFDVIKPAGRGFYSATYVVEYGNLGVRQLLKISPTKVYDKFDKLFEEECKTHHEVSSHTEHIVDIQNYFTTNVKFGTLNIECNVAVLEYVDGPSLKDLFSRDAISINLAGQVSVDLFKIISAFRSQHMNHNDLHEDNIIIKELPSSAHRANSIDNRHKAMAIDLGSVADKSKSDASHRTGDIHQVAHHVHKISDMLITSNPDSTPEHKYRLSIALTDIAQRITTEAEYQRIPPPEDFIEDIQSVFSRSAYPWRSPLTLNRFSKAYNAQAMDPWHVPDLIVDPDEEWISSITAPGPQIITGMRGCGKTMLLRSLEYHARISETVSDESSAREVRNELEELGYIGLYTSATKMLDPHESPNRKPTTPYARLLAAYAIKAIDALEHLADELPDEVGRDAHEGIGHIALGFLDDDEEVPVARERLRNRLKKILISLSQGECEYGLHAHPSTVFTELASAINKSCPLWSNKFILFLLDDVSSRYLNDEEVSEVFSDLIFQSKDCAFKLTSEKQTLEMVLNAPGRNRQARSGRDYKVFDLGAKVYEKVTANAEGRNFISEVLKKRLDRYTQDPSQNPEKILGDETLENIAKTIAYTSSSSGDRKSVYHGITALTSVCVGDIGDVIELFEMMMERYSGKGYPIPRRIQSECYQDFCSKRLFDLNRRGGELKNFAKSFAEASHELLINSAARADGHRLRQYSSVYVRMTSEDTEAQSKKLRDLIDAGVFVFSGGASQPRTKTDDSDPTHQFKLTFRKIYGLSNFIGLAERDRFELSGSRLETWLENPSDGKEILMSGEGGEITEENTSVASEEVQVTEVSADAEGRQGSLFGNNDSGKIASARSEGGQRRFERFVRSKKPEVTDVGPQEVEGRCNQLVLGLGFEERCLVSVRRLLDRINPERITAIEYDQSGKKDEIIDCLKTSNADISIIDYDMAKHSISIDDGFVIIDVSGLAKPVIFNSILSSLTNNGEVIVAHTEANVYSPRNSDIKNVLDRNDLTDFDILNEAEQLMTGESPPYRLLNLIQNNSDITRNRVLFAFSSPKHQRIFSLLDKRDYDGVEIIYHANGDPRDQLSRIAADVVVRNFHDQNVGMTPIGSNKVEKSIDELIRIYYEWFVEKGYSCEFGLTGSKLQCVAAAAISASTKISQAWYVQPNEFNEDNFSLGYGDTSYYSIQCG